MPTEIERKFLPDNDSWRAAVKRRLSIVQGYLANTDQCSVRVRLSADKADLNIKGMTLGVRRSEFEYPIPQQEARAMLEHLCVRPLIEKTRHLLKFKGHCWEIDEFYGDNAGLIVAEIELKTADEHFERPPWLGREVSTQTRYYNVCLVKRPYSKWAPA